MSPATTRQAEPDQACSEAVDLARAAAELDAGPGEVGEHVGIEVDSDRVVTHLFVSLSPAYIGWRWAVTVARAARSKVVTVSESVLLPGPDSLLAPDWVPWTERVRPGDLRPGDLMPASSDDERLVPVVAIAGEAGLLDWDDSDAWRTGGLSLLPGAALADEAAAAADTAQDPAGAAVSESAPARSRSRRSRPRREVATRPTRVLSAAGRDEAAVRWYSGDQGPRSPLAAAAPAACQTCGFMIRLSGPLGRVFGVCANEFAPDDGKVVAIDHGCGAHSDGEVLLDEQVAEAGAAPAIDELGYDMLSPGAIVPESVLETLEEHELG